LIFITRHIAYENPMKKLLTCTRTHCFHRGNPIMKIPKMDANENYIFTLFTVFHSIHSWDFHSENKSEIFNFSPGEQFYFHWVLDGVPFSWSVKKQSFLMHALVTVELTGMINWCWWSCLQYVNWKKHEFNWELGS